MSCSHSIVDIRRYSDIYFTIDNTKPDVIYNLASHGGSVHYVKDNPADVFQDNVLMSINLYKAVSEVIRYVFKVKGIQIPKR